MMSLLSPLQAIAAQRGEGLRPELVRLLERSKREVSEREGQEVAVASAHAVTSSSRLERVR
jgi:hypothetical protein